MCGAEVSSGCHNNRHHKLSGFVVAVQWLSHARLCDPMDGSTPGFPALHHLPDFAQTHVHLVSNAIPPSHPLSSSSPPALSLSHIRVLNNKRPFLIILEIRGPVWSGWGRALFLACRWTPPCCIFTCPFLSVWKESSFSSTPYNATEFLGLGPHPYDVI